MNAAQGLPQAMEIPLPEPDHSFEPNGNRAQLLDREMRRSLASSLRYLGERTEGYVVFDRQALRDLTAALDLGARLSPAVFCSYSELVFALLQFDYGRAEHLFEELVSLRPLDRDPQILCLDAPELRPYADRYRTFMSFDEEGQYHVIPPDPQRVAAFIQHLEKVLHLIDRITPELVGEFYAVVSQLVMVSGSSARRGFQFGGGSSYMLWGALFVNVDHARSDLEMVDLIAHETAHLLLYGFCREEPLVRNPDSELYPSPLRQDLRPMDGIYHATWVSARMHYAMQAFSRSEHLTRSEREEARHAAQQHRLEFLAGHGVVEGKADLTSTGRSLMEAAFTYMATCST